MIATNKPTKKNVFEFVLDPGELAVIDESVFALTDVLLEDDVLKLDEELKVWELAFDDEKLKSAHSFHLFL